MHDVLVLYDASAGLAPNSTLEGPMALRFLAPPPRHQRGAAHAYTLHVEFEARDPAQRRRGEAGSSGEQATILVVGCPKGQHYRDGVGCEPASATTVAGLKKLTAQGLIRADEEVVCVLTGHVLKDPNYTVNYHRGTLSYTDKSGAKVQLASNYANAFVPVPAERSAILKALGF